MTPCFRFRLRLFGALLLSLGSAAGCGGSSASEAPAFSRDEALRAFQRATELREVEPRLSALDAVLDGAWEHRIADADARVLAAHVLDVRHGTLVAAGRRPEAAEAWNRLREGLEELLALDPGDGRMQALQADYLRRSDARENAWLQLEGAVQRVRVPTLPPIVSKGENLLDGLRLRPGLAPGVVERGRERALALALAAWRRADSEAPESEAWTASGLAAVRLHLRGAELDAATALLDRLEAAHPDDLRVVRAREDLIGARSRPAPPR